MNIRNWLHRSGNNNKYNNAHGLEASRKNPPNQKVERQRQVVPGLAKRLVLVCLFPCLIKFDIRIEKCVPCDWHIQEVTCLSEEKKK